MFKFQTDAQNCEHFLREEFQKVYIYIYKSDGKKEQILSIFYVTKAFLLTNLQSVTKIIFLQKKFFFFFICYLI